MIKLQKTKICNILRLPTLQFPFGPVRPKIWQKKVRPRDCAQACGLRRGTRAPEAAPPSMGSLGLDARAWEQAIGPGEASEHPQGAKPVQNQCTRQKKFPLPALWAGKDKNMLISSSGVGGQNLDLHRFYRLHESGHPHRDSTPEGRRAEPRSERLASHRTTHSTRKRGIPQLKPTSNNPCKKAWDCNHERFLCAHSHKNAKNTTFRVPEQVFGVPSCAGLPSGAATSRTQHAIPH